MATPESDPESACGVSPAQFCAKRWPASMFAEVVRHAKSAGRWEEQQSVQLPVMTLLGGPSGVGSSFDCGTNTGLQLCRVAANGDGAYATKAGALPSR